MVQNGRYQRLNERPKNLNFVYLGVKQSLFSGQKQRSCDKQQHRDCLSCSHISNDRSYKTEIVWRREPLSPGNKTEGEIFWRWPKPSGDLCGKRSFSKKYAWKSLVCSANLFCFETINLFLLVCTARLIELDGELSV